MSALKHLLVRVAALGVVVTVLINGFWTGFKFPADGYNNANIRLQTSSQPTTESSTAFVPLEQIGTRSVIGRRRLQAAQSVTLDLSTLNKNLNKKLKKDAKTQKKISKEFHPGSAFIASVNAKSNVGSSGFHLAEDAEKSQLEKTQEKMQQHPDWGKTVVHHWEKKHLDKFKSENDDKKQTASHLFSDHGTQLDGPDERRERERHERSARAKEEANEEEEKAEDLKEGKEKRIAWGDEAVREEADRAMYHHKVRENNLLVVMPCATHRHSLVYGSRHTWRQGMKTFIASNGTQEQAILIHGPDNLVAPHMVSQVKRALQVSEEMHLGEDELHGKEKHQLTRHDHNKTAILEDLFRNMTPKSEVWATFPDEWPLRGYNPGESRWVAALRLANETYKDDPTWRWMLYGDDDMFFFVPNLLDALSRFNHSEKYLISDDIGGCCHGTYQWCEMPQLACVPPYSPPGVDPLHPECIQQPAAPPPCSPSLFNFTAERDSSCPKHNLKDFWFYGGHGVALSRALVESISQDDWMRCERELEGGGDRRVSECFWHLGIAPTLLNNDRKKCRFGRFKSDMLLKQYNMAEQRGSCESPLCKELIYRPVSTTVSVSFHGGSADKTGLLQLKELWDRFENVRKLVNNTKKNYFPMNWTHPTDNEGKDAKEVDEIPPENRPKQSEKNVLRPQPIVLGK